MSTIGKAALGAALAVVTAVGTAALTAGEVAMHTGRPNSPRAARSRLPENEVTHTRSHAAVRRSTPASRSRSAGTAASR